MDKEKQIEEMAKIMCGFDDVEHCATCSFHNGCVAEEDAKNLYTAGYRKAADVAREIFEEIDSCVWSETQYGDSKLCFEINSAKYAELKKKYTEDGK